jgi:hypothetical protein
LIQGAGVEAKAELSLEKARLDLLNTRTQLTVGLILVAILATINFAHLTGVSQNPTWLAGQANTSGYLMTSFAITLACSVFVALICLECTGRYGNRLRAVPAIWSALLFNLCPPVVRLTSLASANREYELNCLFLLIAAFAFNRWFLLKEKLYLSLAGVSLVLLVANGFLAELTLPHNGVLAQVLLGIRSLLIPAQSVTKWSWSLIAALVSYSLLAVLALAKIVVSKERPKYLLLCLVFLIVAICFSKADENQVTIAPTLFYAAAPFALALTFLAFPTSAQLKLSHNRVIAVVGLMALTILALSFAFWAQAPILPG